MIVIGTKKHVPGGNGRPSEEIRKSKYTAVPWRDCEICPASGDGTMCKAVRALEERQVPLEPTVPSILGDAACTDIRAGINLKAAAALEQLEARSLYAVPEQDQQ